MPPSRAYGFPRLLHYVVSYPAPASGSPAVELYVPLCGSRGNRLHTTRNPTLVTCQRCLDVLDRMSRRRSHPR
jgi:hypothetical protein